MPAESIDSLDDIPVGYIEGECWYGIDPSYTGLGFAALIRTYATPDDLQCMVARMNFSAAEYGRGGKRLKEINMTLWRLMLQISQTYTVRGIGVEGYAPGAKFNREILGELGGIVRLSVYEAFQNDPAPLVVPPSSVKKFATGKGNAPKDNVLLAVYRKWGESFTSNDIADAYTIARIVYAADRGTDIAYEQAVLDALSKPKEKK